MTAVHTDVLALVAEMGDAQPQHVEAVERAKALMRRRMHENLTVDDMCAVALFSKFHFTRVFRSVTGMSPARYLATLRLEEAKRLLRSTDRKIVDITYDIGYSSVGTFSSRFREMTGVPPTEYRRTFRAGADTNVEAVA